MPDSQLIAKYLATHKVTKCPQLPFKSCTVQPMHKDLEDLL